jgi:hypothetical protein
VLDNVSISIPNDLINQEIIFLLRSEENPDWQLYHNYTLEFTKTIQSGFELYPENENNLITNLNPLLYTVQNIYFNDSLISNVYNKKYRLMKYESSNVDLDINFNSLIYNGFNNSEINNLLSINNNTQILNTENILNSYIKLNEEVENNSDINCLFRNYILTNNDISILLDAPTLVDVYNIDLSGELINDHLQGIIIDSEEDIAIELVKDLSETINLNYRIINNSLNTSLNLNSININNSSSDIIISDNTNYNYNSDDQYNLAFTFSINNESNTEEKIVYLDLNFENSEKSISFMYSLPIKIKVMDIEDIYTLNKNYGSLLNIYCKDIEGECTNGISYKLNNNTKTYDFDIVSVDINTIDPIFKNYSLSPELPLNIIKNNFLDYRINIDANYINNSSYYENNLNIIYEIELNSRVFTINDNLDVLISYEFEDIFITIKKF